MGASNRTVRTGSPILTFLWWTLVVWVAALLGLSVVSVVFGFQPRHLDYLVATALVSFGVVAVLAVAGPPALPSELRKLRVLAVVLPSAFIAAVEIGLYLLAAYGVIDEPAEHVLSTVILSAGAVPLSWFVFHTFARLRDELTGHARRLRDLHDASIAVAGELEATRLEQLIAEGARTLVGSDRAALMLGAAAGGRTVVVPAGASLEGRERDLMSSTLASDARERSSHDEGSALVAPLTRGGQVAGALAVLRDSAAGFTAEDEMFFDTFVVAASSGLENVERLAQAQLIATVEERERISRDLHDDLGQLLAFLSTEVEAIRELVTTGQTARAGEELERMGRSVRSLGLQVRQAILGLRAHVGPDRPLGEALREYSTDFGVLSGLDVVFEGARDAGRRLPGPVQYELLRIVQEALSNVQRHARAREVRVRIEEVQGCVEILVADDGEGFSPAMSAGGFGLKTMRERAERLHGMLRIVSSPGTGTSVRVHVPIEGM